MIPTHRRYWGHTGALIKTAADDQEAEHLRLNTAQAFIRQTAHSTKEGLCRFMVCSDSWGMVRPRVGVTFALYDLYAHEEPTVWEALGEQLVETVRARLLPRPGIERVIDGRWIWEGEIQRVTWHKSDWVRLEA